MITFYDSMPVGKLRIRSIVNTKKFRDCNNSCSFIMSHLKIAHYVCHYIHSSQSLSNFFESTAEKKKRKTKWIKIYHFRNFKLATRTFFLKWFDHKVSAQEDILPQDWSWRENIEHIESKFKLISPKIRNSYSNEFCECL